ncbi:MAG TPA: cysteine--tRNA ligase [Candidatus Saccharimonadales bacterium]|nr:cysteine--tRNA ligase [Candidatus Saccharimonadales bacterium]
MRLYNTLSRKIEELKPQSPPQVKVYTCGPTVYDYAHVGHWFNYVRMDSLIRTLKANGYSPTWIMNITDVGHLTSDSDEGEDKLQKGARREGKSAWDIAEFYTRDFIDGMRLLNITEPNKMPKATDHISEQIDLIKILEQDGFIYVIDDGVYFDTSKFPDYSKFARLDLDEQLPGARVSFNPSKRNGSDFALWKFTPTGQQRDMEWDSPWGKGFPGWHIECSAMSLKYLGETLDIHTGGIDHVPVHHTNEIAQSQSATGKPLSRLWLHSNHVTIDGIKISKSLENGIRLQDIADKKIPLEALRLHIMESHYRNQSKFTWQSLQAAQNRWQDLRAMAVLRWQPRAIISDAATFALEDIPKQLLRIMSNDLDTPQALRFLSTVSNQILSVLIEKGKVKQYEIMLKGIDEIMGFNLLQQPDITDSQKKLLADHEVARSEQKWEISDKLRDKLFNQKIGLRDTPQGTIWFRL